MALTEGLKGSLLLDGTIQTLISTPTELKFYSGRAFVHNLVDGDKVEFVIYDYDPQSATQRVYDRFIILGAQPDPVVYFPNLETDEFRVTAEQTAQGAGGFKTLNFVRHDK